MSQLEASREHLEKNLSNWGGRLILGLVLCLLFPLVAFASGATASPDLAGPPLVDKPVTVTVGLYVASSVQAARFLAQLAAKVWMSDRDQLAGAFGNRLATQVCDSMLGNNAVHAAPGGRHDTARL